VLYTLLFDYDVFAYKLSAVACQMAIFCFTGCADIRQLFEVAWSYYVTAGIVMFYCATLN
jgi:hypothetical protein